MTSTTREIFDNYEIRKSKKQKTAFIQWVTPVLDKVGYPVAVENGSFGARNIVIGDVKTASVIYTAHYDTCAVMPFPNFITPKSIFIYILYQLVICIPIFALIGLGTWLARLIDPAFALLGYWVSFLAVMGVMTCGPANKHTANDNTSGTTAIIDLALAMPEELRGKAAFVLFDLEESGLLGSSSFASRHKQEMKEKLLVNLDCVSDGETMLFVLKKGAHKHLPLLKEVFTDSDSVKADFATKGYVYPSDQANFKCGVGVASLKKTKGGLLYMDKIHTARDTVYREENIAYLVDGCIRLTEKV